MTGIIKKAVLGLTLGATALSVAAPADAQRWRGGYRDRDRGISSGGAAVLGGIVGLGLGAAIASGNRDRYYDRGYYYGPGPRGYYYDRAPRGYYRDRYYAPPPPRAYYRDGYYGGYYDRPYRGYYGW